MERRHLNMIFMRVGRMSLSVSDIQHSSMSSVYIDFSCIANHSLSFVACNVIIIIHVVVVDVRHLRSINFESSPLGCHELRHGSVTNDRNGKWHGRPPIERDTDGVEAFIIWVPNWNSNMEDVFNLFADEWFDLQNAIKDSYIAKRNSLGAAVSLVPSGLLYTTYLREIWFVQSAQFFYSICGDVRNIVAVEKFMPKWNYVKSI